MMQQQQHSQQGSDGAGAGAGASAGPSAYGGGGAYNSGAGPSASASASAGAGPGPSSAYRMSRSVMPGGNGGDTASISSGGGGRGGGAGAGRRGHATMGSNASSAASSSSGSRPPAQGASGSVGGAGPQRGAGGAAPQRSRGKERAPRPGEGNHCSFCLLAEFDIDKGSTLTHQYPEPTGHDTHVLAELMLPDGAHLRHEDWTVFFLKPPNPHDRKRSAFDDYDSDDEGGGGPGGGGGGRSGANGRLAPPTATEDLTFVLNLVRTKHDTSVRRGALVKAMCIGTRHPYIQVFKPLLLVALDRYFQDPGPEHLARLYDAVNGLDLSAMPVFTREERLVLRGSDRRDLFEERFVRPAVMAGAHAGANANAGGGAGSAGAAAAMSEDASTAVGDEEGAEASAAKAGSVDMTSVTSSDEPPNTAATTTAITTPSQSHSMSSMLGASSQRGKKKDTRFYSTMAYYNKLPIPIHIPLTIFPEEIGDYSMIQLVQTFSGPASAPQGPQHAHLHSNGSLTHPITLLFNAMATQKRIVFLGHGQPAHNVASFVLAASALGSGCGVVFEGFAGRVFPYTNLTNLDELETVPAYIAGVTNPRFEDLHAWDVLFNIESGKVTVSKNIEPAPPLLPNPRPALSRVDSLAADGTINGGGGGAHASNGGGGSNSGTATASGGGGGGGGGATITGAHGAGMSVGSAGEFGAVKPAGSGAGTGGASGGSTLLGGRERSGTVAEARADAPDNLFIEDVLAAIQAHCGEDYVRQRFVEHATHFVRVVARHEEHFYGHTSLAPASQPFLNGQLGSGALPYAERDAELRDIMQNAPRAEAFRGSYSYRLYRDEEAYRLRTRAIVGFDCAYQLGRLRRSKPLAAGEAELIFSSLARCVQTPAQIVELLSQLPSHAGGLAPLALGVFHPSPAVRVAALDLFTTLAAHAPAGAKLLHGLNAFVRLALARSLHARAEAPRAAAAASAGANAGAGAGAGARPAHEHAQSQGQSQGQGTPTLGVGTGGAGAWAGSTPTLVSMSGVSAPSISASASGQGQGQGQGPSPLPSPLPPRDGLPESSGSGSASGAGGLLPKGFGSLFPPPHSHSHSQGNSRAASPASGVSAG